MDEDLQRDLRVSCDRLFDAVAQHLLVTHKALRELEAARFTSLNPEAQAEQYASVSSRARACLPALTRAFRTVCVCVWLCVAVCGCVCVCWLCVRRYATKKAEFDLVYKSAETLADALDRQMPELKEDSDVTRLAVGVRGAACGADALHAQADARVGAACVPVWLCVHHGRASRCGIVVMRGSEPWVRSTMRRRGLSTRTTPVRTRWLSMCDSCPCSTWWCNPRTGGSPVCAHSPCGCRCLLCGAVPGTQTCEPCSLRCTLKEPPPRRLRRSCPTKPLQPSLPRTPSTQPRHRP